MSSSSPDSEAAVDRRFAITHEVILATVLAVEIAVLQRLALPKIIERLLRGQILAADGKQVAGMDRPDLLVDAHVHPAEFLDDLVETAEVDHGGTVEVDSGQFGERRRQELDATTALAAVLERRIDLVQATAEVAIRIGRDINP